jgi:hypothetical protein
MCKDYPNAANFNALIEALSPDYPDVRFHSTGSLAVST